jgi:hypothetical protein
MMIRGKLCLNYPNLTIGVLGAWKIGVKWKRRIIIIGRGEENLQEEGYEERGKENKTSRNVMTHANIPDKKYVMLKYTIVRIITLKDKTVWENSAHLC